MVKRGNVQSTYKYEEDDDQEHPALSGYRISGRHGDGGVCHARWEGSGVCEQDAMNAFRVTWVDTG